MSEIREMMWSKESLVKLEARYKLAKEKEDETFTFRGESFYTDYAKYLIEHLNNEFNK